MSIAKLLTEQVGLCLLSTIHSLQPVQVVMACEVREKFERLTGVAHTFCPGVLSSLNQEIICPLCSNN